MLEELHETSGEDLGGGCRGCAPLPEMTCGFLKQLVFCKEKKTMWLIGVEVEQETSAPPPKKDPGSTPGLGLDSSFIMESIHAILYGIENSTQFSVL